MEILQIKDLSFRYPETEDQALKHVSLSVRDGEFILLCGESGCGKSTLLKLIKRELAPFGEHEGEIVYCSQTLSETDERRMAGEIGFVLQDPESQIVTDSVWHELAFGLENMGYPTPVIRRRVAEMAGYFGIEDWFHRKTADLSGGQKQLLNLASVMVMQPKVLLLDEPTAQLDPIAAANFIATLQKLNRELGLTILLVEHRLEEVFPVADRVLLMDKGRLCYNDVPKRIHGFFQTHPHSAMLAGLPAAMRIYGALEQGGDSPLTVREGREYVTGQYGNQVRSLEEKPFHHSPEKVIEFKEVWFRYERDLPDVLKGTSLSIYQGEHFCILGGNGAGKTTALNLMAGLKPPYRGHVLIRGKKIKDDRDHSLYIRNVALLPQNPQTVFLEKTVAEDLTETCKLMQYSQEEMADQISEITEKLGIAHLLERHPYDLSGGEQQKAALAKVLLLQPRILLLDEPTKGIDAGAKETLLQILKQLQRERITVVTVTHDVEFAAQAADRCGMFFDGEMVSVDRPRAFFSENHFYTTAANRISRNYYAQAVRCEDVVALCRLNGRKGGEG